MRKILYVFIILLIFNSAVYADSDGYYSTGNGVIVYEEWMKYPNKVFLIFFGNDLGISDPVEITLPKQKTMNVNSLQAKENEVTIILRDLKMKRNDAGKFIKEKDNLETYIYDIQNKKSPTLVKQSIKPYDNKNNPPRPEGNLGLWSNKGVIPLNSNDNSHSYQMVIERKIAGREKISPSSGIINHEHITKIIQKDTSGKNTMEKVIFKGVFQETID